ncbi:MAG TPA: hypothetical protein PK264_13120, partial [Hyphomicrobiaceae bacterium]|nr:hypothetical protein [Hyphomicrobiaceae bacterium]
FERALWFVFFGFLIFFFITFAFALTFVFGAILADFFFAIAGIAVSLSVLRFRVSPRQSAQTNRYCLPESTISLIWLMSGKRNKKHGKK